MLVGLAFFVGLVVSVNAVVVLVISRVLDPGGGGGRVWLGAALGLLAIVLVVGAVRFIRRVAAPLGDVMEAADQVATGDYTARVDPAGVREVRRLARSFNAMVERLERNESQRRDLLADLAHELRTPLSVIRGNLEGILDGLYQADEEQFRRILRETDVMARLLEDLRTLSTADAGVLALHREIVTVADLVEPVIESFALQIAAGGVDVRVEVPRDLPDLEVDPVRIAQVLTNLLSNALRHTPAGGSVVIRAATTDAGVAVTVTDTGGGIAPADLPRVFERFVSFDRGGSGLGLAVAHSLVTAHGGTITVDTTEGVGTSVTAALPAAPTGR